MVIIRLQSGKAGKVSRWFAARAIRYWRKHLEVRREILPNGRCIRVLNSELAVYIPNRRTNG